MSRKIKSLQAAANAHMEEAQAAAEQERQRELAADSPAGVVSEPGFVDEDYRGIPAPTVEDAQREIARTAGNGADSNTPADAVVGPALGVEAPNQDNQDGNGGGRKRRSAIMLMGAVRETGLSEVINQFRSKRQARRTAGELRALLNRIYDDLHIAIVRREEL